MAHTITRRCYIARYPLNESGDDLREEILAEDTYYSPLIRAEWDKLVAEREPNWKTAPQLQCWYVDQNRAECLAQTNQPFRLS